MSTPAYREQAARDLLAIGTLRKSDAFNDYFLRRLRGKHAELTKAFKYGTLTPEQREEHRQQILLLEWIIGSDEIKSFMAIDEPSVRAEVEKPTPEPAPQGQTGDGQQNRKTPATLGVQNAAS